LRGLIAEYAIVAHKVKPVIVLAYACHEFLELFSSPFLLVRFALKLLNIATTKEGQRQLLPPAREPRERL
jgi:hypothetical protein